MGSLLVNKVPCLIFSKHDPIDILKSLTSMNNELKFASYHYRMYEWFRDKVRIYWDRDKDFIVDEFTKYIQTKQLDVPIPIDLNGILVYIDNINTVKYADKLRDIEKARFSDRTVVYDTILEQIDGRY